MVTVEIPADMQVALWMKFLSITPCSGLGALTRAPKGIWWHLPATRQMSEQAIHEVMAVAQARGVALPIDALHITLALLESVPPEATFSMQRDIMAGRPSELDAQIGAVLRLGQASRGSDPTACLYLWEFITPGASRTRAGTVSGMTSFF